jgi:hypothetical protein
LCRALALSPGRCGRAQTRVCLAQRRAVGGGLA